MCAEFSAADSPVPVLDGVWSLVDDEGDHAVDVTFPGDCLSALIAAGMVADPYVGSNEVAARWPAERNWTASRSFDIATDTPLDHWHLEIAALDTVADISINGVPVHSSKNVFRRYRPDVAHALRAGDNHIEIRFHSSVTAAAAAQAAQPWFIPWSTDNCAIPNGNMLRKPQCDFGWDWNIALAPFGIYEPLVLRRTPPLTISDVLVGQVHDRTADRVRLEVTVHANARTAGINNLELSICGVSAAAECELAEGENKLELSLDVSNPVLWWPAGHGEPVLHDLLVTLDEASTSRRIGLREIRLISDRDDIGRRFALEVNGMEVYCRGANWIPADALPGRVTRAGVADLLTSALDANMNLIRVWGGGRYEPDWFYDLCDEMGLMVWQDFMFACNLYPSTPEFLAEVDAEVRDVVRRISHHASIALWCGDNELIGALNWFEISRQNRDRYLVAYDRLNRTIEAGLVETAPHANWWPSSPSPGPMDFGDAWHNDASGDMHVWTVWHEGKNFSHYRTLKPRFCSEFGFQSFPSMPVARRIGGTEDFNISSPVMEAHQKNAGGNARIAETMFRYFRFPKDFESFVWLSQIQQGLALKTAVDYWRSLKPHCMGTLYWQLNDTWPVASWASLDHGGGWKAVHHMVKRFFQPVNVVAIPDEATGVARLSAVNDTRESVSIKVTVEACSLDGARRAISTVKLDCPPDRAVDVATVPFAGFADDEFLLFGFEASNGMSGSDHLMPRPYKAFDLPDTAINVEIANRGSSVGIKLSALRPAFFATLECAEPGRFSDNVRLILPGEPVELKFIPADGDVARAARNMTLNDLRFSHA